MIGMKCQAVGSHFRQVSSDVFHDLPAVGRLPDVVLRVAPERHVHNRRSIGGDHDPRAETIGRAAAAFAVDPSPVRTVGRAVRRPIEIAVGVPGPYDITVPLTAAMAPIRSEPSRLDRGPRRRRGPDIRAAQQAPAPRQHHSGSFGSRMNGAINRERQGSPASRRGRRSLGDPGMPNTLLPWINAALCPASWLR